MRYSAKCRNGDEVEMGIGDSYPPGHVGQHTNVDRVWVRVPGKHFIASPERSLLRTTLLIESCESAAELVALTEDEADTGELPGEVGDG